MVTKFLKVVLVTLFSSFLALQAQEISFEEAILNEINIYRQSKGLNILINNDILAQVAMGHSKHMALKKVPFGHKGFKKRVNAIEKQLGPGASAENVAYGYNKPRDVVQGWINSPGHRKNLEGDFKLSGIGIFTSKKGVIYFTHLFYTPMGAQ